MALCRIGIALDCVVSYVSPTLKAGANVCVDTGVTVAAVTTDFIGVTRPQGGIYDIGPREQNSGALPATPKNLKVQ